MDVINRFLKYVSFETTSNENSTTVPSSKIQLVLADFLVKELKGIGIENAHVDEKGYVYANIPASKGCENCDTIGLIAHMDTSPDVSGKDVKPQIIAYNGGDIALSDTQSIKLSDFPFIEKYIGHDLIVTDGTPLLGADNKAGIAETIAENKMQTIVTGVKTGNSLKSLFTIFKNLPFFALFFIVVTSLTLLKVNLAVNFVVIQKLVVIADSRNLSAI